MKDLSEVSTVANRKYDVAIANLPRNKNGDITSSGSKKGRTNHLLTATKHRLHEIFNDYVNNEKLGGVLEATLNKEKPELALSTLDRIIKLMGVEKMSTTLSANNMQINLTSTDQEAPNRITSAVDKLITLEQSKDEDDSS